MSQQKTSAEVQKCHGWCSHGQLIPKILVPHRRTRGLEVHHEGPGGTPDGQTSPAAWL